MSDEQSNQCVSHVIDYILNLPEKQYEKNYDKLMQLTKRRNGKL